MKRRSKFLVALACLCAGVLSAQEAPAKYRTYYTGFDVTVRGQMVEKWTKNINHEYSCSPRTESSGGATIRFSTPKKTRVTAGAYGGFHGSPKIDVSVDRDGQSREVDLDGSPAPCGDINPDRDGSACGHRDFGSRLQLPKTSRFGLFFQGDKHEYGSDCPYPPATPTLAEDSYESTSVIGSGDSKIRWYPKLFGSQRNVTFHFTKHFESPYGKPEWGDDITGTYAADITWTVKFHRVEKAHTGR